MLFEKVTIVISATDETNSLIKTVETTISDCDISDIDSFMIVVPEKASEECLYTIDYLIEKYPEKVKKLVQTHPYIGGAMRDSIVNTDSSHILFFSADIPVGLESIPEMIEKAKKSPDKIIKVSRWIFKNSFYGYNSGKKILNYIGQKFLRVLFDSALTDFTIPILIAPTEIYKNINFKEWNFPCMLEAVLVPLRIGCSFEEIPAKSFSRTEGKSKNSILQTLLYLKTAIRVRFTKKQKLHKNISS